MLDGMTELDAREHDIEMMAPEADWNKIPKDVKIYMFQFMSLQDYAAMSQVSKSWRKAAKKSPLAVQAQEQERAWAREKEAAARRARLAKAQRRRERRRAAAAPLRALADCIGWACCCAFVLFILWGGWTAMTGIFLWFPFPEAPGERRQSIKQFPPFSLTLFLL